MCDCELGMVDAEQMQHRGMEIPHMHDVLNGVVTEIVGRSMRNAPPNAAAGQKHAKALDVMIAADLRSLALPHGSASKFAADNDERFTQESATLQIG